MNKQKKTLLMSAISLLLSISMLIGSTFAWFTDSVTSANNKIHSGTLKVDLELLDKETGEWNSLKESQAPIFNYDKWEPGYIDTKVLKVENEGNLAVKWVAKFYSEYQLSILADVIDVYVRPSDSEIGYPTDRSLEGYTFIGNLRTFINSIEETTWGTLDAKEASYLGIALKMREEAGNDYQGLSLGGAFDIRIYATQYTSEWDSFGNQYDKNATFDVLADPNILTSQAKYINTGAESVDFSIIYKGVKIVSVSVPEDAIADKSKPVKVTISAIEPYIEGTENSQTYAYDIHVTNLKSDLEEDQFVTVVIGAPKGLASMKVYHKDELVEDAVYDEVAGTITFRTANFSPFSFTTEVYEVQDLASIRDILENEDKCNGAYIKLTKDIEINLSKGSADRSGKHVFISGSSTYYNAVNIVGKDVAIDLNGHSITLYCGHGNTDNSDVGALFYVGPNGSLNILDDIGGGFIKMRSSVYAVWAPYAEPSYVDIFGGAFIADSYAGDPLGTALDSNGMYDPVNGTMKNENSNRALVYAGTGGNINVYGGYFLYNNTPNDSLDRNNGAFNAKDHYTGGPLITIHEGVYLINKEYRQNPLNTSTPNGTYDNESVVLSEYGQILDTPINETIEIDNVEYSMWYKVTPTYKYKVIFMNSSGNVILDTYYVMSNANSLTINDIDNTAYSKLDSSYQNDFGGWVTGGSVNTTTISAGNTKNILLYPSYQEKITVRFVDQHGNIVYEETIVQGGTIAKQPSVPVLDDFAGSWEEGWTNKIKNAKDDITIYPVYEYSGNLSLKPIDVDGDGTTDYYQVESVSNLDETVTVPGYVNGYPVKIVEKLTASYWDDTKKIILEEGIEVLQSESLAGTPDLSEVSLPLTINRIEKKAFSSNVLGAGTKNITFTYNGSKEDFEKITLVSGWDEGLGNGTTIICNDGSVYKLSRGGIFGTGSYTWTWSN